MSYTVNLIFGADQEKIIDYLLRDEKIIDFIIDINKVPVKEVIRYTIKFTSTEAIYLFGHIQASSAKDAISILSRVDE